MFFVLNNIFYTLMYIFSIFNNPWIVKTTSPNIVVQFTIKTFKTHIINRLLL